MSFLPLTPPKILRTTVQANGFQPLKANDSKTTWGIFKKYMSRPLPSAVPHPSPQTNEISVFRSASSPISMFFEASLMILTLVCGLLRNFLGCFEWHVVLAVSPVAHLTLTLCVRLIPESPWKAWACLASPFPVLFLCFCPSSYIIGSHD